MFCPSSIKKNLHGHFFVVVVNYPYYRLYYMAKSMLTLKQSMWRPKLCTICDQWASLSGNMLPLLFWFQLFHKTLAHGCRDLLSPSLRSTYTDAGQCFLPKVFSGLESLSHTPKWEKHFFMVLCFVHRGIVMLEQERAFPTCLPQH